MSKIKKIVIAGGGTGGHIYPGLAIAQALKEHKPEVEVHFVGAKGGLEEKIIPAHGYPLHLIRVGKLHQSVGRKEQIKTLMGLPFSLLHCLWLAWSLRPQAALGVGGFASGPFIFVAKFLGIRTYLWEPNAQPGWTNRILSYFVSESLLVFEKAKSKIRSRRVRLVGMPVRKEIRSLGVSSQLREPVRLLVFGGSQGARAINDAMMEAQRDYPQWFRDVHLVHQTGAKDFGRVKKKYSENPNPTGKFEVFAYLHDMPSRLEWADVVLCRAGASTVAEVSAARKAAIFVPFPFAADDHQRKNAEALVEGEAALMLLQKDLTGETLIQKMDQFKLDPELLPRLQRRLAAFDKPGSGLEIAKILLRES